MTEMDLSAPIVRLAISQQCFIATMPSIKGHERWRNSWTRGQPYKTNAHQAIARFAVLFSALLLYVRVYFIPSQ